tara:strand:+ start:912 stop:1184 length:273 start_codon:yes stop_codon:yes gene_type:complete
MLKSIMVKAGKAFSLLLLGLSCSCASVSRVDSPYKYYVIDVNADVPDAYFENYEEAASYQKEFAEFHEYVIVKINNKFNVYNMTVTKNEN